jgi:hypothetical protein
VARELALLNTLMSYESREHQVVAGRLQLIITLMGGACCDVS